MQRPLREIRHEHRLTMTEVAMLAGVTYGVVQYVETGKRTPSLRTARKISEALGVAPDEVTEFAKALELRGADRAA
ncbi:MAG: helix-turn-helix domain-containing protein [Actinomycetota bacterium]|nr:helix-turn-helix domain-containing protein [Actinomycetota bacterium]